MLAHACSKHEYTCLWSTHTHAHTNTHRFKHRWITLISCAQSPQGPPAHALPEIIERRHTQAIKYSALSVQSHALAHAHIVTRRVYWVPRSVYSPWWHTSGARKLTLAVYLSRRRRRARPMAHIQANVHTGNHPYLIIPFITRTHIHKNNTRGHVHISGNH